MVLDGTADLSSKFQVLRIFEAWEIRLNVIEEFSFVKLIILLSAGVFVVINCKGRFCIEIAECGKLHEQTFEQEIANQMNNQRSGWNIHSWIFSIVMKAFFNVKYKTKT